ncbi:glutamine amidotransferases class-II [Vibrio orientalis CIP 102891 = ATCC 33934]|nr:glutamine amidotransferases class-II [Vibrio orientalis CIP 102891 = ATCC 33934]
MFLHNGQIGGFEQVKFELERQLCESLFLKRMGTTDSELIFLLMLQNELKENPVEAIKVTLSMIVKLMESKQIEEPLKASICISDGIQFWVVRYSSDQDAPTVFIKQDGANVVLASEPLEKSSQWKQVSPQSILAIHLDKVTSYVI